MVLLSAAWSRGAEYDEQYSLFLTAGVPRPPWPDTIFTAGLARAFRSGHASVIRIAADLRATDVHPPLYFWVLAIWRAVLGPDLLTARLLSTVFAMGSLVLTGAIAGRTGAPR